MKIAIVSMLASMLALFVVICGFSFQKTTVEDIPYPEGYRRWTHVKSSFLDSTHPNIKYRGFNHIYANDKAMEGYLAGIFPDGSVIVFDVIESVHKVNHSEEAKRNHIDIMVKDGTRFAATGGWGFGQFEADKTPRILTAEITKKCSDCHASQKDYVFSEYRQ